ncbi:pyridoxamine 5'-phosphate oxidase family protein [Arenimonas composti]|uniref:General stress protein FMN-binding split barrel domain-containing protein n=1 Tax=Arenimonas composti TR7-09 = DSM 18010 TaxID=1121013 RepID=A0A091BDA3_9GAMM|nr:pyridoxamine 5'-phosphate oxidase family protein [Arenimonas composti]KFN50663.1 hypothetical protein P873_05745 [Arenimonas composti TR7-09 = DSM 18010]
MTNRDECLRTLREKIKDHHVAMLVTRSLDGKRLLSRPLGTAEVEFDGDLWFASGRDSEKVREVQADPAVNVTFASEAKNSYVSLSGRASIITDRAKIEELWSPLMKPYFPAGKDDPNLCLIHVEVETAEYWDSPGGLLGSALHFAVAGVTGDAAALSENERVLVKRVGGGNE